MKTRAHYRENDDPERMSFRWTWMERRHFYESQKPSPHLRNALSDFAIGDSTRVHGSGHFHGSAVEHRKRYDDVGVLSGNAQAGGTKGAYFTSARTGRGTKTDEIPKVVY